MRPGASLASHASTGVNDLDVLDVTVGTKAVPRARSSRDTLLTRDQSIGEDQAVSGRTLIAATVTLCVWLACAGGASATSTTRVSLTVSGRQALGGSSERPAISSDGRFVAFDSQATNLVGDTNGISDVFVHDRQLGTTRRVSVATDGSQATGGVLGSRNPAISSDGRFVAFQSDATNLVPGDGNGKTDIFVRDLEAGTTTRASVPTSQTLKAPALAPEANGNSINAAISSDGRVVAFQSTASNLTTQPDTSTPAIYVRDMRTGVTERVVQPVSGNVADGQSADPVISSNGRLVAFDSAATNYVTGDTNGEEDVFVADRQAFPATRASVVGSKGTQANGASFVPRMSSDGRFVEFTSRATNLDPSITNNRENVFVRDRLAGTTTRASVAAKAGAQSDGDSLVGGVSDDGRFVAFDSLASNLVPGDTNDQFDVFVRDLTAGTTTLASVTNDGLAANDVSGDAQISSDGRFVAFSSDASNLVPGDTNGVRDVFVRDLGFAGFSGSWKRTGLECATKRARHRCTVSGRLEITNPGTLSAAASKVDVFLSANRRLGPRDQRLTRLSIARLRAGRTRSLSYDHALKHDASGQFLIAKLDATDVVKEPNEKDNVVVSKPLSRS
jgi:archaellum component FlaF (FlaF/FlaG flagellin family)